MNETQMAPQTAISETSFVKESKNGMKEMKRKGTKRKAKSCSRKGVVECPIFLRKTYLMVDTCNPDIATWSEEKDTSFLVKDTEKFASIIIPQYFKHSNFASFVRQLNFYGFRKIKSDSIKLTDGHVESKYWYFRHDKFLKGRKDLLNEIRKSNQVPVQDQEDVCSLKAEVASLEKKVSFMDKDLEKLMALMSDFGMQQNEMHDNRNDTQDISLSTNTQIQSTNESQNTTELMNFTSASDRDLLLEPICYNSCNMMEMNDCIYGSIDQQLSSVTSEIPQEMELEDSPLFVDLENDTVAMTTTHEVEKKSMIVDDEETKTDPTNNSSHRQPLYDCLAVLPKTIQEQIVDEIATTIANFDFFKDHIDAVSALAKLLANVIPSEESKDEILVDGTKPTIPKTIDEQPSTTTSSSEQKTQSTDLTLKLVSTVLAAFLTQNGANVSCHDVSPKANQPAVPIQV